ncbi:armadillo repeat-containing protein 2 isoform X2 [Brienomyrus brachyistius]|uniref:armadillo repeat-containing protein 2 isoform X2 n=1 Tax=Brienomyrus brachyistius TaxID=42636 RepID=UPI0020B1F139|nr:armadillo repeat-containing protein 2 isoform X2 [Brienomyrus brachyistius]
MSANKPFYMSPSLGRKTSAEIVSEARRSLRTVHTQRPFTPKDDQRRLLGQYPCRALESRPPSSFSLEARHFEESDSRPGSGKRLSPLEYRPQMPPLPGEGDHDHDSPELSSATPTSPTNPQQPRTGSTGRARLLRANPARGRPLMRLPAHSKHNSDPSNEPGHSLRSNTQQDGTPDFWLCEKGDPSLSPSEKAVPLRHGTERPSLRPSRPTRNRSGSVPRTARGNGNYAATEAEETTAQKSRLSDLLQEIHSLAQAGAVEELCCTCERLHIALAEGAVLGRNSSVRPTLLRTLFKLVDLGSDKLSLHLANLTLVLGISGNNLLNICKLIFRVSRDNGNDALFRGHPVTASLLTLLRHSDACSDGEALLYCVGALKFLSADAGLRRQLQAAGAVRTLLLLAGQLNGLHAQTGKRQVVWGHILLQLTATLRNLAELPECRPEFLTRPGLPELCGVLTLHAGDADVCTNVARIFSKLSSYHDCCLALADTPSCYPAFSMLLRNHSKRQDLVVRILFTLGSLTAKSDVARRQTCGQDSNLLDALLPLFQTCRAPCATASEDVLAKLTRVLANAAICPATGAALVANAQCVHSLLDVLERSLSEGREEVILNTTIAINNLSFYESDGSVLWAQPLVLARVLLKQLLSTNMDVVLEAMCVLGNISRSQDVRDFILHHKAYRFAVALLDSKRQDLCYACCGVLTNLSTDRRLRTALRDEGVVQKLLDCLRDWGPLDWQLASVACQALWNCSEDGGVLCFEERHCRSLLRLLSRYLNKDHMLHWTTGEGAGQEVGIFYQRCWESEFLPVAQRLQDRIQRQVGAREPLAVPS